MVSLRYGNVHEVPICFPIIKYPTGEKTEDTGGKPIRYDRFTCHKDRCNLCRCDVSRGYKLSNDSRNAECVMLCPVTKHTLKRCFNIGTARICYHWSSSIPHSLVDMCYIRVSLTDKRYCLTFITFIMSTLFIIEKNSIIRNFVIIFQGDFVPSAHISRHKKVLRQGFKNIKRGYRRSK